jgi:drug/metabolite transporter (DMT)-like permease
MNTETGKVIMIGELCALLSACFFSTVSVAIRRGMKTSRDNGTFLSTFINMVLFLILIAILYLNPLQFRYSLFKKRINALICVMR